MTEFKDNDEMAFLQSPSITKLMPALIEAYNEFDAVVKDSTNPHFRSTFGSYNAISKATDPALYKHRLLKSHQTGFDTSSGHNFVLTRIIHESGEWIGGRLKLKAAKENDPQAEGSALTYAKRQTLKALLGLADVDDDGNAASAPRQERRQAPAAQTKPEPSGRDWAADATILAEKAGVDPLKRREQLLALMEECQGFQELTPELYAKFVELGNAVKALAEAA